MVESFFICTSSIPSACVPFNEDLAANPIFLHYLIVSAYFLCHVFHLFSSCNRIISVVLCALGTGTVVGGDRVFVAIVAHLTSPLFPSRSDGSLMRADIDSSSPHSPVVAFHSNRFGHVFHLCFSLRLPLAYQSHQNRHTPGFTSSSSSGAWSSCQVTPCDVPLFFRFANLLWTLSASAFVPLMVNPSREILASSRPDSTGTTKPISAPS